ncbi:MAG: DUF2652 domain-containing protein [Proteobacteria bacterium]|nr:DUF2652 domain-containing protein [Pseudomonadota bacterium]
MNADGVILIADIKGYTKFLSATEIEHANFVVVNLFSSMLEDSPKGLKVMEVEGDALFCWLSVEQNSVPPRALFQIVQQQFARFIGVQRWFVEVRGERCDCHACIQARDLRIKFLLHYGRVGFYQIANFEKIAGLDVVIAHRLLKNSVPEDEYILVTKDFEEGIGSDSKQEWLQGEDEYPIIGRVNYSYRKLDRGLIDELITPPFVDEIDTLSSHL